MAWIKLHLTIALMWAWFAISMTCIDIVEAVRSVCRAFVRAYVAVRRTFIYVGWFLRTLWK